MADPADHPSRCETGEGRQLHRQDRRVAADGRQDPEADVQTLGDGERRRRQRDPGGVEAVLDHPQLIDATGIGPRRDLADQAWVELTGKAHTEP